MLFPTSADSTNTVSLLSLDSRSSLQFHEFGREQVVVRSSCSTMLAYQLESFVSHWPLCSFGTFTLPDTSWGCWKNLTFSSSMLWTLSSFHKPAGEVKRSHFMDGLELSFLDSISLILYISTFLEHKTLAWCSRWSHPLEEFGKTATRSGKFSDWHNMVVFVMILFTEWPATVRMIELHTHRHLQYEPLCNDQGFTQSTFYSLSHRTSYLANSYFSTMYIVIISFATFIWIS